MEVQICTPLNIVRTAPELQRKCLESAYSLVCNGLRITDLGPCSIERRRSRSACTAPLKRSGLAALTETTYESTVGTLTSYDALDDRRGSSAPNRLPAVTHHSSYGPKWDFAAGKSLFSQWPIIDNNTIKRQAKGK